MFLWSQKLPGALPVRCPLHRSRRFVNRVFPVSKCRAPVHGSVPRARARAGLRSELDILYIAVLVKKLGIESKLVVEHAVHVQTTKLVLLTVPVQLETAASLDV